MWTHPGLAGDSVPNVFPVGRNGMHRYNNADHSMYTAMFSVENFFGAHYDVWAVNVKEEYHEWGMNVSPQADRPDAPILPRRSGQSGPLSAQP